MYAKEKGILPADISKHTSTREKTIILLMIPNEEKGGLHYLAVKKVSTSLRGIKSRHFYCFNCFILLQQKMNFSLMKKYVKIKISVVL